MATHSSINAWRIPWTQEPGRLSPWGHRGRHDLATNNNKYQRLMNFLSQMKIIKKKQFVKRIKTREFLLALGRRLQDLCFWFFLTLSPMTAALEAAQGSLTLWPMTKKNPVPRPLNTVVVQSLHHVWLFVTPWTAARHARLPCPISQNLLKLMCIESVKPSNHLILCNPLLLLPSVFPSIRIFSNESALHIKWSKYWTFSFSISPSNEYSGLISFRIDWFDLLAVQGALKSLL